MGEDGIKNVYGGLLDKGIPFLEKCGIIVAMLSFVVMLIIISVGTMFRFLLSYPLSFVEEYSGYLLVIMGFLAIAPAFRRNAHVDVNIVTRLLPMKVKVRLKIVVTCLALFVAAILLWVSITLCWENYSNHIVSSTVMEVPLWIPQLFIPVGWVIFILVLFLSIREQMTAIACKRIDVGSGKLE